MTSFTDRMDRAIMAVSPSWGASRRERRLRHGVTMLALRKSEAKMRAWEAAERDRARGETWLTSRLSPASALEEDLETLWDRSEDLVRSNCYAAAAVNARVDNVIGRGIRFQSRIKPFGDLISEQEAIRLNQQIEERHSVWARIDGLRRKQRLYEYSKCVFGEGLGVLGDVVRRDSPVPLTWTIVSPRRLETPPKFAADPLVRLGIRFTDETYKTPAIYYIRRTDPNDTVAVNLEYDEIPAERVTHSFDCMFPGQVRGFPWLSPVEGDLKDLGDFKEARVITEQVTACTSAFIKTEDPYGRAIGAKTGTNSSGQRVQELSPASVEYIGAEEDVVFNDPNRPGNTMEPFMSWYLRGVAAAIRLPYELLCKHFGNSFAGGRLAMSDGKITFQCWQQANIDDALFPLYSRFLTELVAIGGVPIDPAAYVAFAQFYQQHAWIPQGWPYAVNPMQEVKAESLALADSLTTKTESLSTRGTDFDETIETRKRERIRELEADAEVESRRAELAKKLGQPAFGQSQVPVTPDGKEESETDE